MLIAIHDMQLAEHGGGAGLRDGNLFESALAKPENLAAYGDPMLLHLQPLTAMVFRVTMHLSTATNVLPWLRQNCFYSLMVGDWK